MLYDDELLKTRTLQLNMLAVRLYKYTPVARRTREKAAFGGAMMYHNQSHHDL